LSVGSCSTRSAAQAEGLEVGVREIAAPALRVLAHVAQDVGELHRDAERARVLHGALAHRLVAGTPKM
jgi:hypothetical protein